MFKTFFTACIAASAVALDDPVAIYRRWPEYPLQGNKYQSATPEDKLAVMWQLLTDDTTPKEIDYDVTAFLTSRMNDSTCRRNDQVADKATKTAHHHGTVGQASWVSVGEHPYNGLYTGAEHGVIRLSDSGLLFDDINESNPSFALKFLREGETSGNLTFAIDWNNQHSKDFFPKNEDGTFKPFTNHPRPFENTDSCERVVQASKLSQANAFPYSTGTGMMAEFNVDGSPVEVPRFPFETIAMVNPEAIPEWDGEQHPLAYLASIEASGDIPLFYIYARDEPSDEETFLIAEVYTSTPQTTSRFGDDQLLFRHQSFNRDLKFLEANGEDEKKNAWRKHAKSTFAPLTMWNDDWNEEMPISEDWTAEEIVHESMLGEFPGAEGLSCPFAWILKGSNITDGMIIWGDDDMDDEDDL